MQSSEWINLKTMNFIDRFVWTFGQITVTTTTREKNTISHQTFPMAEKCAVARLYVTLHCRSVNLILTYIYIYTLFSVKFIYGCCGCSCCRRRRRRYCYFYDRCSHKCTCICAPVCVCVCVWMWIATKTVSDSKFDCVFYASSHRSLALNLSTHLL